MYRKDMFEQAGITVNPDPNYQPTWQPGCSSSSVDSWAKNARQTSPGMVTASQASHQSRDDSVSTW